MIARRDFALGAACVVGAAAAYALKPRRVVSLMSPGQKLSDILPSGFEGWASQDVSDLVAPETPDSLAARLYGETVGRIYQQAGAQVIMLMAHGDVQSNELQLHRPEVCYPAFGFTISESVPMQLPLARDVFIPSRKLIARSSERQETILYWTRLGEFFPITVQEQRLERLQTAMHRYIADGLLARFSVAGPDTAASLDMLRRFIPRFVAHIAAAERRVIIGTAQAARLAR